VDFVAEGQGSFYNAEGIKTYQGEWKNHLR
jgi:hypothetical protein